MENEKAPADLITEQEARDVLQPFFGVFAACHLGAFESWRSVIATEHGKNLSPTARARLIWDRGNELFGGLVAGKKDVRRGTRMGLIFWDFNDQIMVRFKFFKRGFMTRGIPTEQRKLLEEQGHVTSSGAVQMRLFPKVPMLVVGYALDDLATRIARLSVVLQRGGKTIWSIDIPLGAQPATLPVISSVPSAPVVRSKRKKKENPEAS